MATTWQAGTARSPISHRGVLKAPAGYMIRACVHLGAYYTACLLLSFGFYPVLWRVVAGAVPAIGSSIVAYYLMLSGILFSMSCPRGILYGVGHEAIHRNLGSHGTQRGFWTSFADFFAEGVGFNQYKWIEEHCLEHHVKTGVLGDDPDEELGPIRLNVFDNLYFFQRSFVFSLAMKMAVSCLVLWGSLLERLVLAAMRLVGRGRLNFRGKSKLPSHPWNFAFEQKGGPLAHHHGRWWTREHLWLDNSYVLATAKGVVMQLLLNFLPLVVVFARQSGTQGGVWGALARAYGLGLTMPEHMFHSQPLVDACLVFFWCTTVTNGFALFYFQSSHITADAKIGSSPSDFYPLQDWGEAQLANTVNFKAVWWWPQTDLEYQIEHHLFPTLSVGNIAITQPIVKQTAKEFGLVYHEYSFFGEWMWKHVEFMMVLSREKRESKELTGKKD